MQYVLSESELKRLVPAEQLADAKAAIEWLRKRIALRCIHLTTPEKYSHCDDCPVGRLGKEGPPDELRDIICSHQKSYRKW